MSKFVTIKFTGVVTLSTSDMQSDLAEDIREMCDLDPFDAVEDEHIELYMREQDVQELAQEFGIDCAEIVEVTLK